METTVIERAALVAEFQAKAALRCGREGDETGKAKHIARMDAVIRGSAFPTLVGQGVVQLLGRGKARVVQIPLRVIDAALKDDAPKLAVHYDRPLLPLITA